MSAAMNMNSQLEPKIKLKNGITVNMMAEQAVNWKNHATKYPNGVRQSNGTLATKTQKQQNHSDQITIRQIFVLIFFY